MSFFKFSRDGYIVKVENVAPSVSSQDIVELFGSLIGDICKCSGFIGEGNRRFLELTFSSQDAYKKALCMTGYTMAGVPFSVTPMHPMECSRMLKQNKQPDMRRNLYVLGLPFDLTKVEFVELFARYGTVTHAVILATVDNASRRRGFIVMNTHNEARYAMDNLSRKEIKGHTIDVSWAVVQRSQGFLDGGDRTVMLSNPPNSSSPATPSFDPEPAASTPVSAVSTPALPTPLLGQSIPLSDHLYAATSLLVSNLPTTLFSTTADLHPLFCPFGEVKHLKILGANPSTIAQDTISVLVEYASFDAARDARDSLNGQAYASQPLQVDFWGSNATASAPIDQVDRGSLLDVKARLNPHAPPFIINTNNINDLTVKAPSPFLRQRDLNLFEDASNGWNALQSAPLTPIPTPYNNCLLPPPVTHRPSSAPSRYVGPVMTAPRNEQLGPSIWSAEARIARAMPWSSSSHDLHNLSASSLHAPYFAQQ